MARGTQAQQRLSSVGALIAEAMTDHRLGSQREDRLAAYVPATAGRRAFHASAAVLRCLQAPNQVGKTWMGAAEAMTKLVAETEQPTTGLIITSAVDNVRPVHRALWELRAGGEIDWDKTEYIRSRSEWRGGRIVMKNGNRAFFAASSQDLRSIAGETVDWMWIDEPPDERTFGELLMRTVARTAPVWMTFTPVADQDLGWLERMLWGDVDRGTPPEQEWEIYLIELSREDVPWLTDEQIAHYHKVCPEHEKPQRLGGQFRGFAIGRVFSAFRDAHILEPPDSLEGWELALGVDHGEGAGHQIAHLVAWHYDEPVPIRFIDEYVNETHTTTAEDAVGIMAMLERAHVGPQQVGLAVGDSNTAGKEMPGRSINDLLGGQLGVSFVSPSKPGGSVATGNKRFNDALAENRIGVARRCTHLLSCLRQWQGAKDRFKHARDSAVYIGLPLLNLLQIGVANGNTYESVKSGRRGRGRRRR